jgi:hypothetical protein
MKIKDKTKKAIVEEYQRGIREAIENIKGRDGKMSASTKQYILTLEENIKRAPYVLGYAEWPEEKKKKKKE